MNPQTSLGFSAIDFASEVLNLDLFPWQRWLLVHALELREGGGFRFRNVVVLVARQNGKSTLSQVLALWFMYVYGYDLVLGTAQDLDTAEEVWQGAVDLVTEMDLDDQPLRPDLFELYQRTVMVNGKKSLELKSGARYKAKAASRRSGRGLSGDLVILDELREHQSWDAWGAITKTTMARDEAQVWALSNAGDSLSIVLDYLRKMAHAALGDPDGINGETPPSPALVDVDDEDIELDEDDDSLGIFEWSAAPGCDIWDRNGWAQGNPSLGYKIGERTVASAARTDPPAIFRTEVLCQWVDTIVPGALDIRRWADLSDPQAERGSPVVFGLDVTPDRMASIAVAWRRPDGAVQVMLAEPEIPAHDAVERCAELARKWRGRVVPPRAFEADLERAGAPVRPLKAFAAACGAFADAVTAGTVRHGNQPELNLAVKAARWRAVGTTGERAWELKDCPDVGPLVAATRAVHGLVTRRPPAAPQVLKTTDGAPGDVLTRMGF